MFWNKLLGLLIGVRSFKCFAGTIEFFATLGFQFVGLILNLLDATLLKTFYDALCPLTDPRCKSYWEEGGDALSDDLIVNDS